MRKRVVNVMPCEVDAATAIEAARRPGDAVKVGIERQVWYPYFSFDASCRVPTLVGRRAVSIPCLVDAINGVAMTCDRFQPEAVHIDGSTLLAADIASEQAAAAAERAVAHQLGKRARMIAEFRVELDRPRLVYRRFWVVRAGERLSMVDSVSGALQSLQVTAA